MPSGTMTGHAGPDSMSLYPPEKERQRRRQCSRQTAGPCQRASATGGGPSQRPSPTPLRPSVPRGARRREKRRRAPSRASGRRRSDRPDPVDLLEEQSASRVQELVPIRYGRMLVSPFTFYRGAAYPMAADLAGAPRTGLEVQLCGDAHLSNFGAFAAPDRRLIFSINDFDETLPGPVRVGRQAAGGQLCRGRPRPRLRRQAATRDQSRGGARVPRGDAGLRRDANLDLWYARIDIEEMVALAAQQSNAKVQKRFEKNIAKAQSKDNMKGSGSSRRSSRRAPGSRATRH